MSKFRDHIIDVQDEIEQGDLSYRQIAIKYNLCYDDVCTMAEELREYQQELYTYE